MPQPIDKIVRDPEVFFDNNILSDKPEMAALVCQIFATWARIEHELSFLLVRILGADADAAPAIAIYSVLTAQHLQLRALGAAAEASMSREDFDIFSAALTVADSVQTPRNHLAHWSWGGCRQKPEILALIDPKMMHEREFELAATVQAYSPADLLSRPAGYKLLDTSKVLAYRKADLERALRDLTEAWQVFQYLAIYLSPSAAELLGHVFPDPMPGDVLRAFALEWLNKKRLFREALSRRCAKQ